MTTGARSANERRVLSLIRRNSSMPKADLARSTGLSPTAITSIIRKLEADGLLMRGQPQRGRVGQPSVPYSLNPDGAASLGLTIGRRSAELLFLDATMIVRSVRETIYDYPLPKQIVAFVKREVGHLIGNFPRSRLAGLGIAMPHEIWAWGDEINVPESTLGVWRDFDLADAFQEVIPGPIAVFNDATAACAAQRALHPSDVKAPDGADAMSFVYLYVGWFIGGGVVLNGRLLEGARGNAGALGSMPICVRDTNSPKQLIKLASLHCLEREMVAAGMTAETLWKKNFDWSSIDTLVDVWIAAASKAIAQAIAAAASVIDFDAAVIDGSFPDEIRRRLVDRVVEEYERIDRQGIASLSIHEGSIGRNACAIGAACLPILSAFGADGSDLLDGGHVARTVRLRD